MSLKLLSYSNFRPISVDYSSWAQPMSVELLLLERVEHAVSCWHCNRHTLRTRRPRDTTADERSPTDDLLSKRTTQRRSRQTNTHDKSVTILTPLTNTFYDIFTQRFWINFCGFFTPQSWKQEECYIAKRRQWSTESHAPVTRTCPAWSDQWQTTWATVMTVSTNLLPLGPVLLRKVVTPWTGSDAEGWVGNSTLQYLMSGF